MDEAKNILKVKFQHMMEYIYDEIKGIQSGQYAQDLAISGILKLIKELNHQVNELRRMHSMRDPIRYTREHAEIKR